MENLHIYGSFFGGFFAVLPLVCLWGIGLGIKRAMWSSAFDSP